VKVEEAPMIHQQTLIETPLIRLYQVSHPSGEIHCDPDEEAAFEYSINFVEQGHFDLKVEKERWRMDERQMFLTSPALVFRCQHDEELPQDVCLSVCYDHDFAEEIRSTIEPALKQLRPALPLTNRLAYLRLHLDRLITRDDEVMAIETMAGDIFIAALTSDGRKQSELYNGRRLIWYAERVDAARELFETAYAAGHSLASVGRHVGMSPYHFARVFRELTGTPPHQYLLKVRLARAAERLREGVSVTEVCFDCGFANPSHFTRSFHRHFGVPPSRFRSLVTEARHPKSDCEPLVFRLAGRQELIR
jgi:AraC-like DNA-binding protein